MSPMRSYSSDTSSDDEDHYYMQDHINDPDGKLMKKSKRSSVGESWNSDSEDNKNRSMKEVMEKSERKVERSDLLPKGATIARRIWNEEDEITILKAKFDFIKGKRNYGPDDFYTYIKNSINTVVSRNQLRTKFRILKRKYGKLKEKSEDEKAALFSKYNREKELFELSEKLWGDNSDDDREPNGKHSDLDRKVNGKRKHNVDDQELNGKHEDEDDEETEEDNEETEDDEQDFWCKYPRLNASLQLEQFSEFTLSSFVKERLSSIGDSKATELEDKWRKLQIVETEAKLMRARLIEEQTELILKAIS